MCEMRRRVEFFFSKSKNWRVHGPSKSGLFSMKLRSKLPFVSKTAASVSSREMTFKSPKLWEELETYFPEVWQWTTFHQSQPPTICHDGCLMRVLRADTALNITRDLKRWGYLGGHANGEVWPCVVRIGSAVIGWVWCGFVRKFADFDVKPHYWR